VVLIQVTPRRVTPRTSQHNRKTRIQQAVDILRVYRARSLRRLGMYDKAQLLQLLRREAGMR